jgi:hypothetical protein
VGQIVRWGLLLAALSTRAPLWAIGGAVVVMLVALYLVFGPTADSWPIARPDSAASTPRGSDSVATSAGEVGDAGTYPDGPVI